MTRFAPSDLVCLRDGSDQACRYGGTRGSLSLVDEPGDDAPAASSTEIVRLQLVPGRERVHLFYWRHCRCHSAADSA